MFQDVDTMAVAKRNSRKLNKWIMFTVVNYFAIELETWITERVNVFSGSLIKMSFKQDELSITWKNYF